MGRNEVSSTASDYFAAGNANETPEHDAVVASFALDKYEVTVGRFRQFVNHYNAWHLVGVPSANAGANSNVANTGWDASWTSAVGGLPASADAFTTLLKCSSTYQTWTDSPTTNESYPINCVSWYEAFAFCIWDGGRLPTEAEWEYAAAGGASHNYLYPWGITSPDNTLANFSGCTGCSGTSFVNVGSYPAGKSSLGIADLAGSVWEWVFDGYSATYYGTAGSPVKCTNCANATDTSTRVLRGGAWLSSSASLLRAVMRVNDTPDARNDRNGFRCARTAQ